MTDCFTLETISKNENTQILVFDELPDFGDCSVERGKVVGNMTACRPILLTPVFFLYNNLLCRLTNRS